VKTQRLTIIFFAMLLSVATFASEKQRHIQLQVQSDEGEAAGMQAFRFDSDEAGFNLDELQLGESRSYIDEVGNNMFVVRTEEGFDFDINGRKISVPDFSKHGDVMVMHDGDESHSERHVIRKVEKVEMVSVGNANELVMPIELNLELTELDIELNFDDMDIHEGHETIVFEKEVNVTN
jgi:hypothetical protein